MWFVIHGEAIEELKRIEDDQFDSIVTDPPYGLSDITWDKTILALTHWLTDDRAFVPDGKGFMGKNWDKFVPPPAAWDEAYRVLKPGGYLLAFAGTRTYDMMCLSIRLAGFEIRDSIHWFYGSGFPKSHDLSKSIDKTLGAKRAVIGSVKVPGMAKANVTQGAQDRSKYEFDLTSNEPATDAAKQWQGWGTALKPAHEPIVMARKPFKGTVASNVLEYGTGGINVDGCRIAGGKRSPEFRTTLGVVELSDSLSGVKTPRANIDPNQGRWPANLVFSHSPDCTFEDADDEYQDWCADDCPVAELDRQSGNIKTPKPYIRKTEVEADKYGDGMGHRNSGHEQMGYGDTGGASRFFYCAKASKKERPQLDGIPGHPTVKPLRLMRYLVRLVTQPGGSVLDLFAGSGTTGEACELEGFNSVLIENDPESVRRIDQRMNKYEVRSA